MTEILDLFGDPVSENFGRRGRPAHVPTAENRNKVKMLLALGWSDDRISNSLSITPPTLKKHYFRELKFRDEMRDRLESRYAMIVWREVEAGSGAAFKEFRRIIEHGDAVNADQRVRGRAAQKPAATQKLGKKEERQLAAERVAGKFTPPAPPMLIVDNR